jgi:hypothetical protein
MSGAAGRGRAAAPKTTHLVKSSGLIHLPFFVGFGAGFEGVFAMVSSVPLDCGA